MAARKKGFTLVEVLIAVLLLGVAIATLMAANTVFTQANGAGATLATSEFLIEQIRERTAMMHYTQLAALDNVTYSPPINGAGGTINDLSTFSQVVVVENVSPADMTLVVADNTSDFSRITVSVTQNGNVISTAYWIRTNY